MTDDRTYQLLLEIRDLQRQHVELYREALANQTQALKRQEEAIAFQRSRMRLLSVVLLPVIIALLLFVSWFAVWFYGVWRAVQ